MCTCTSCILCSFLDVKSGWPFILLVWFCLICNETRLIVQLNMENHALNFMLFQTALFIFSCTKHKKGILADCTSCFFFSYSEIEWEQWTAVHFHCMEKYILDILLNISVASSTIYISYFYSQFYFNLLL